MVTYAPSSWIGAVMGAGSVQNSPLLPDTPLTAAATPFLSLTGFSLLMPSSVQDTLFALRMDRILDLSHTS